ncbi:MAG: GntR family transcriptional regulator [Planctomycetes bacterium]|nr:GntR family transcriptional regulator [Planctomycetota bacterium]
MLKHREVVEALRKRIRDGVYEPGSRLPGETELPRLLKAGKQTVVRALGELVREGLIVRRRGDGTYVADPVRPPLVPGRHLKIGVLWPRSVRPDRMQSWFQGEMTRGLLTAWGLEAAAPEWDRSGEREPTRVVWSDVGRAVTVEALGESSWSRERHPALEAVQAGRFDGLVALSIIEEDWLARVLDSNVPAVLVDFPNERFASRADQVYVDPTMGFRAAVRALYEQGARRIHFVGAEMVVAAPSDALTPSEVVAYQHGKRRIDPDSFLRLSAFRAAMDELGLVAGEDALHFEFVGREARMAERLLALPEEKRPDAVVCHSASQAEGLQSAFAARGLRLPAAGCVSGAYRGPALPIHTDGAELGRTAAELLLWRMQRPERPALRVGVPMTFDARLTASVPSAAVSS